MLNVFQTRLIRLLTDTLNQVGERPQSLLPYDNLSGVLSNVSLGLLQSWSEHTKHGLRWAGPKAVCRLGQYRHWPSVAWSSENKQNSG